MDAIRNAFEVQRRTTRHGQKWARKKSVKTLTRTKPRQNNNNNNNNNNNKRKQQLGRDPSPRPKT